MHKHIPLNLRVGDYEGPFDLLLDLIKENKMNILELNIRIIADQYASIVEKSMGTMPLDELGEFLYMASWLTKLKSSKVKNEMLKNLSGTEEIIDEDMQKLIDQILEHKKYQDICVKLNYKFDKRRRMFSKEKDNIKQLYFDGNIVEEKLPANISIENLTKAFENVYDVWLKNKFDNQTIQLSEVSIEAVQNKLRETIVVNNKMTLLELMTNSKLMHVNAKYFVLVFCSLLEMAKYGEIFLVQDDLSKMMTIIPNKDYVKGEKNE